MSALATGHRLEQIAPFDDAATALDEEALSSSVDSPAALVAPLAFEHPQANRELLLQGISVGYALRRGRRRTIGFRVDADGLTVSSPHRVGQTEIDLALREKGGWIVRKLAEQRERQKQLLAARLDWREGVGVPYLGETVIVRLDPCFEIAREGAALSADTSNLPGSPSSILHVGLPKIATSEQIRCQVRTWLQREARRVFEARCRHFAARLGVQYKRLCLSSARTRWGSASVNGSIRLNWRLIHFALPTIDYVVVHELSHLIEMNHSPRFWAVVRAVLPDFEQARQVLKTVVLPVLD